MKKKHENIRKNLKNQKPENMKTQKLIQKNT